jgi:hypothetical protein
MDTSAGVLAAKMGKAMGGSVKATFFFRQT